MNNFKSILRLIVFLSFAGTYPTSVFAQKQAPSVTSHPGKAGSGKINNELPVDKLRGIKFRFHAGGPIRGTSAIANGIIYFGCGDGYLYAIDSRSGEQRWMFKTGGAVYSSPAIADKTVYFTSRDGNLYALDAGTGKLHWKFKMGKDLGYENYWDNSISSPIIIAGTLFVGSGDGYLYAINKTTGKISWKYNAGARIRTNPVVSGNHVVFGTNSGIITDVNRLTGHLQWKFATDGAANTFESRDNDRKSIYCTAAISDGMVVTGGRDGIVYGVDLITGKEKWRYDHKGPWILSAIIKDGVAYIGCGSDYLLQALDLKTGLEKWRLKTASAIFSSLTLAGNIIYFTDVAPGGNLYAVDITTHTKMWQFPLGAKSFSTPVVANGMVYCGSENGILCALQGSGAASQPDVTPRKIVYWEKKKNSDDYNYFQNGVDEYLRNYFTGNGYELADGKQLEKVMNEQLDKNVASVIVFADNRFPQTITGEKSGQPLIRKYLDAGGKVVLFAVNPMAYVKDTAGNVTGFNDSIPAAVFGLKYVEKKFVRGIYQLHPTTEGFRQGLYSSWTGSSGLTVVSPDSSIKPLAIDEFGSATEWLKNYGGRDGTGLLQLYMPPNEISPSLPEIRAVIEYGVCW